VRLEPTFRLGPPDRLFDWRNVEEMLCALLADWMRGHRYNAQDSAQTACDISTAALTRLKALALPRYCYC